MKKVFVFSNFPSKENPTNYYFIQNRINILKNHYRITVITISDSSNSNKNVSIENMDGYDLVTLYTKKIGIPKLRYFYKEYQIRKLLDEYITKNPPDLIHVHFSSFYSWLINKISKKNGIPYIITEHASFFEEKIKHFYFGPKIKLALKNANKIITVSPSLKSVVKEYVQEDIEVVPNVIDTNHFNIKQKKFHKRPKMISVGSLDENDKKGYELLLKVLKMLNENGYEFECEIIGKGPNKNKLQDLIEKNSLTNVKLLGTVKNPFLPSYYNDASFFVSSSKIETFGVAVIEAMSCGLPVVTTISGGPENFVTKEVGLISEQTVHALYSNLAKMLETYKSYSPNTIRRVVVNNFSEEMYYSKMRKIYEVWC